MILKLGMKHQGEKLRGKALQSLYKSWPWDDLDLFYGKVNIGRPWIWMGKIVKMSFEGENLQEMGKWTEYLCLWKNFVGRGLSDPAPGLYTCISYMTIIFKHFLLWNHLVNQSQTLCGALLGRGNENGQGHMTKMAAMAINSKNL